MYDLWPVDLSRSTPPLLLCQRALPFLSKYEIRLLLRQTRLSNQHLSWQHRKGPSLQKCVWVKMEEGDSLAAERREKKKTTVEAWKSEIFLFPFPLVEKEESFQGPEIVKCYFSSPFFEAQGNLKSRGYSSLVTIPFQNWGLSDVVRHSDLPRLSAVCCARLATSAAWDEIAESFF